LGVVTALTWQSQDFLPIEEKVCLWLIASDKKEVRGMVFVITGAAESGRNAVGRRLADVLGWEFVDAENLRLPANLDARKCSTSRANDDPTLCIETLSGTIIFWIYEWRDVVVSCQMLTENDRRQLSKISSLVKIVCLEAYPATACARVFDRPLCVVNPESPAGWHGALDSGEDVLTVDLSRQVEEIIEEVTTALIM
jgi:gluconokinase